MNLNVNYLAVNIALWTEHLPLGEGDTAVDCAATGVVNHAGLLDAEPHERRGYPGAVLLVVNYHQAQGIGSYIINGADGGMRRDVFRYDVVLQAPQEVQHLDSRSVLLVKIKVVTGKEKLAETRADGDGGQSISGNTRPFSS